MYIYTCLKSLMIKLYFVSSKINYIMSIVKKKMCTILSLVVIYKSNQK